MGLKDKLLQAAAIGTAFLAVSTPKMSAVEQDEVLPQKDAITQKADIKNQFAPSGKQSTDQLKFSLMGIDIDTEKFEQAKKENPDLENVDLIKTDKELGISIKDPKTEQAYQIFASRSRVMSLLKDPSMRIAPSDVVMGVREKDGTSRSMNSDDAENVASTFIDTLYQLDDANLIDANATLAKAADVSKFTIKMAPKSVLKGKMAEKLNQAICEYQESLMPYIHNGNFMTAMNQGSGR